MATRKFVHFETTNWSELASLTGPEADSALAALCLKYWEPLYAFARRRFNDVHLCQDLTQGFFQHILSKNILRSADRDRGRFRTFLLAAFKNYVSHENSRAAAKRRGGDLLHVPLDFEEAERAFLETRVDRKTPEQHFDRMWTLKLIHDVRASLRAEQRQKGQADRFDVLEPFLAADSPTRRMHAASELGLSQEALRAAISRLRRRFRELLKAEVALVLHDSEDVDDEIRQMFQSLA
ncbi:MAG: sigma-70 family RNA polymerase sigma factor [Planctomycetales bacterium]|nr:sigma-70 family RNA polymerase sigma factor [Planctomycetales bacterium]